MKLILPGGAGFLGRVLSDYFAPHGYEIVALSRGQQAPDGARLVHWDGETLGDWAKELEGADAIINFAGRSVNCRYNDKNKQEIYNSRLNSTRVLGEAIAQCQKSPPLWINSSSATIYRHAEDRDMDEETGEIGHGFSVDVCRRWEEALEEANTPHTRKVTLRTAMVFGPQSGGVMDAFASLAKRGLGGTLGPGTQWMSWIHVEDFARTVEWILQHNELFGAINCAAPNPLPNREFMQILRETANAPIGLPVTSWTLEIGAFFMGTETELLLKSRRVVPGELLKSGFVFRFPDWRAACENILHARDSGC
jgi:hypothetical protein